KAAKFGNNEKSKASFISIYQLLACGLISWPLVRAEGIEPSRGYPQRIFVPSTAFAASPSAFAHWRVRGLDYTFTVARARLRCCPSSLYTFPLLRAWLGIARLKVPPNLSSSASPVSRRALKSFKSVASTVPPRPH